MLARLPLALLWSTACWAAQMYGNGGGQYFCTTKDPEYELSGIRVTLGPLGIMRSVQVKNGPSWDTVYGNKIPGKTEEFLLAPGEHIIEMWGSYKAFLWSLGFYTDRGRYAIFGKDEGSNFIAYPDDDQKVLTAICGQYKMLGLTGLIFDWDYIWEEEQGNATAPER
ncbi:zymogen granule protein 16 homolog B [Suricata suricatta]|nr:zymogen granule protein 16 homolog B [Suricata suricatta]